MTNNSDSRPYNLPWLTIHAIDFSNRKGLGHDDLRDPRRPVTMSATWPDQAWPGDLVELFWDGKVIQQFELPNLPLDTINFSVQPDAIPDEPEEALVYYSITSREDGSTQESISRYVEVKRSVPGTPDPDRSTPVLNESLPLPAGLPEFIGPDTAGLTVTIEPWERMAEGDVLTLYWGRHDHAISNSPLTVEDLGAPQQIFVSPYWLMEAGDNERLPVTYDIRDRVDNWSLYSPPAYVNVRMNEQSLAAVLIEGYSAGSTLKLDSLNGQDIQIRIPAYAQIQAGDRVSLYFTNDTEERVIEYLLESKTVGDPGFPPAFTLPYAKVVESANGSFSIHYTVQSQNGQLRHSLTNSIQVTDSLPHLAAPTVEGAQTNTLDPAQVSTTGVEIRVKAYEGKSTGDIIHLVWEGTSLDGIPVVYENEHYVAEGEQKLDTLFPPVPREYLEVLAGSTLKLWYSIEPFDGFLIHSSVQSYTIINTVRLPPPSVEGLQDNALDPDSNAAGTYIKIDGRAAALRRGDEITFYWAGEVGSGSHRSVLKVSSDDQSLKVFINKGLVDANRNQTVEVSYTVKRIATGAEQISEALTIVIRPRQPLPLILPAAKVLQAQDGTLEPLDGNDAVTVQVSYEGMNSSDQISLSWNGQDTVATPASQPGNNSGSVSFSIAASEIDALANRIINVQYTVTRDGKLLASDPLPLRIAGQPDMILDSPVIDASSTHWPRKNTDTPANIGLRTGTGGTPPYRYESNNTSVAMVDANGRVTGRNNGDAVITIHDSANRSQTYRVKVKNLRHLTWGGAKAGDVSMSFTEAKYWQDLAKVSPLTQADVDAISSNYNTTHGVNRFYWTGISDPVAGFYYINLTDFRLRSTHNAESPGITSYIGIKN